MTEHNVTWFEEPVSSDGLAAPREVRDQVPPDFTVGEHGHDLAHAGAETVDCLQIDVTRCSGITDWPAPRWTRDPRVDHALLTLE